MAQNADGIVIVDEHGKIILTNSAAEAILGRSGEELRGATFGFPSVAGKPAELAIPYRHEELQVASRFRNARRGNVGGQDPVE